MSEKLESFLKEFSYYLTHHRGFRELTVQGYLNGLRSFEEFLGQSCDHRPFTEVRGEDFLHYIEEKQARGVKGLSIKRSLAIIKCFYEFLYNYEHLKEDMGAHIPSVVRERARVRDHLNVDECFKVLESIPLEPELGQRDYIIISLLWALGLRPSELCALKWRDIDLERQSVLVACGKGGKQRQVFMVKNTIEEFSLYAKRFRTRDPWPVFPRQIRGRTHLSQADLREIVRHRVEEAGIEDRNITPMSFRHSFATHMYEGGASLDDLKEIMGHDKSTETASYIHTTIDVIKKALGSHLGLVLLGSL